MVALPPPPWLQPCSPAPSTLQVSSSPAPSSWSLLQRCSQSELSASPHWKDSVRPRSGTGCACPGWAAGTGSASQDFLSQAVSSFSTPGSQGVSQESRRTFPAYAFLHWWCCNGQSCLLVEGLFKWTHLNGWGGFEACFTVVSFAVMKDMVSEISREACKFRTNDKKSQFITFRVPWPWYKIETCECYHLSADHSVETVCKTSFSTLGNFKHIFRLQSACQCSYLPPHQSSSKSPLLALSYLVRLIMLSSFF